MAVFKKHLDDFWAQSRYGHSQRPAAYKPVADLHCKDHSIIIAIIYGPTRYWRACKPSCLFSIVISTGKQHQQKMFFSYALCRAYICTHIQ